MHTLESVSIQITRGRQRIAKPAPLALANNLYRILESPRPGTDENGDLADVVVRLLLFFDLKGQSVGFARVDTRLLSAGGFAGRFRRAGLVVDVQWGTNYEVHHAVVVQINGRQTGAKIRATL